MVVSSTPTCLSAVDLAASASVQYRQASIPLLKYDTAVQHRQSEKHDQTACDRLTTAVREKQIYVTISLRMSTRLLATRKQHGSFALGTTQLRSTAGEPSPPPRGSLAARQKTNEKSLASIRRCARTVHKSTAVFDERTWLQREMLILSYMWVSKKHMMGTHMSNV